MATQWHNGRFHHQRGAHLPTQPVAQTWSKRLVYCFCGYITWYSSEWPPLLFSPFQMTISREFSPLAFFKHTIKASIAHLMHKGGSNALTTAVFDQLTAVKPNWQWCWWEIGASTTTIEKQFQITFSSFFFPLIISLYGLPFVLSVCRAIRYLQFNCNCAFLGIWSRFNRIGWPTKRLFNVNIPSEVAFCDCKFTECNLWRRDGIFRCGLISVVFFSCLWREVSVCGNVYKLHSTMFVPGETDRVSWRAQFLIEGSESCIGQHRMRE